MRNILLVAKREYLEQIRGRAFIFSTVLVPLLIVGGWRASYFYRPQSRHRKLIWPSLPQNVSLANEVRRQMLDDNDAKYTVDVVAPATPQNRAALLKQLQRQGHRRNSLHRIFFGWSHHRCLYLAGLRRLRQSRSDEERVEPRNHQ